MAERFEQILATYQITPEAGADINRIADLLAAEMSIGTEYIATIQGPQYWLCADRLESFSKSSQATVKSLEPSSFSYEVCISIPEQNISIREGGAANLLAIIAGDVFGIAGIKQVSLECIQLPSAWLQYYQGPAWGTRGIREMIGVLSEPLVGVILKPNLGLSCSQIAQLCRNLAEAGVDIIKDDEISVSPSCSPLPERIRAVVETLGDVQSKTGRRVLYVPNVTSDISSLVDLASLAIENGASALLVDAFTIGLTSLHLLKQRFGVPLYAHRVMYALLSNNSRYRIRIAVLLTLLRLLGADFAHVGNAASSSEMSGSVNALVSDWGGLKPTLPVATGVDHSNVVLNAAIARGEILLMLDACLYRCKDYAGVVKRIREQSQVALQESNGRNR